MPEVTQVVIDARFCGPSSSGNGGYTAGLLAQALGDAADDELGQVTVRLMAPPPLGQALELLVDEGTATLAAAGNPIATARRTSTPWAASVVPFLPVPIAAAAAARYLDGEPHPFPDCFVCGPARAVGDGMRLTPGRLPGRGTGCVWRTGEVLDGAQVTEPLVWAAIDCPGGWACGFRGRPMVLGTMTAQLLHLPEAGVTTVVTGRHDRTVGRRSWTSTALYAEDGMLLARAEAIWFQVDAAAFNRVHDGG